MNRKNVLYISYDGLCDPLGQSQIIPYLKGLALNGVCIYALTFEKKVKLMNMDNMTQIKDSLNEYGIKWKYLVYHNTPRLFATLYDIFRAYFECRNLIRKSSLNIIHVRGYVPGFIGFLLKKSLCCRFIFDMRGFWVEEKVDAGFWRNESLGYKIAKCLEKHLLNLADRIIVLTEKAKSFLVAQENKLEGRIDVIPTCVDLEIFKPLLGSKRYFLQNKVVVLYAGSIGTFYGFREIAKFFKILKEREKNSFLLLLVNNDKQIVEDTLMACNIAKDYYRILTLSYPDVPRWLNEADVSLMFYHRDNSYAGCCPTKFAESLACGVPVIINRNIGDCDNIVEKERIGFISDDFQDSSFRKISDEFLRVHKDRDNMRIRCRKAAEKIFSLKMGIEKYLEIYSSFI